LERDEEKTRYHCNRCHSASPQSKGTTVEIRDAQGGTPRKVRNMGWFPHKEQLNTEGVFTVKEMN